MRGSKRAYSREAYLEIVQAHQVQTRLLDLFRDAIRAAQTVHTDGARSHLRGFARRTRMLRRSLMEIMEIATPLRKDPLCRKELIDLDLHLNSLYLHVRGSLDNLAWYLVWEFKILGRVQEDEHKFRIRVSLFRKEFQKQVASIGPCTAILASRHCDWYKELTNLRDPVAHRIPICAVRAILTPPEGQKWQEIFNSAILAMTQENLDEAERLFANMDGIGTYVPVFAHFRGSNEDIRPVWPQVRLDVANMCEIAEQLFSAPAPDHHGC